MSGTCLPFEEGSPNPAFWVWPNILTWPVRLATWRLQQHLVSQPRHLAKRIVSALDMESSKKVKRPASPSEAACWTQAIRLQASEAQSASSKRSTAAADVHAWLPAPYNHRSASRSATTAASHFSVCGRGKPASREPARRSHRGLCQSRDLLLRLLKDHCSSSLEE